jgi:PhnB protein
LPRTTNLECADNSGALDVPVFGTILIESGVALPPHSKLRKKARNIMTVKPIPEGYHTITAYLITDGAAEAIEFYKQAFGATELFRFPTPDGKIGHAEIKIGDSQVMLADAYPEMGYNGPKTLGGSPVSLMIYVDDVDTVFNRALGIGATVKEALADKFYGDRMGTLIDPFGHIWHIATHKEDVPLDEMQKRAQAAGGGS